MASFRAIPAGTRRDFLTPRTPGAFKQIASRLPSFCCVDALDLVASYCEDIHDSLPAI
jgi:hypothetical protein